MTFLAYRRLRKPIVAATGFALACSLAMPSAAFAVTSQEKQAEADAIFAQIDQLQTQLNEAQAQYEAASSEYEAATAKVAQAEKTIKEQTARIKELQTDLSEYAVFMYKNVDAASTFINVVLGSQSFEEFSTALDAMQSVSDRGATLVSESKDARQKTEEAKAEYEEQSEIAKQSMETAQQNAEQIESTQAELMAEADKITQEIAELQAQEEAEAEAARQAAEAAAAAEQSQAAIDTGYSAGASVISGSGAFTHPCPSGSISSTFGYRDFDSSFHKGLDLAAGEGTPYYAADSGTVIYATNDGGYNGGAGNWIVISHGNGLVTKYMHSSAVYVQPGDSVSKGQNIGAVGNTGASFGAHLHFQVEVNGAAVDPLGYL